MAETDRYSIIVYACEHGVQLIDPCAQCPTNVWKTKYGPKIITGTKAELEAEIARDDNTPAANIRHSATWRWIRDAGITHCPKCGVKMGETCKESCPFTQIERRLKDRIIHGPLERFLVLRTVFGFNPRDRYCALFLGVKFPHGYRNPEYA